MRIEQLGSIRTKFNFLNVLRIFVTLDVIVIICAVTLGYHNESWIRFGTPFVYKLLYFSTDAKLIRWSLLILPIATCVAVWKPNPVSYRYLGAVFYLEIVRCILALPKLWFGFMFIEQGRWIYAAAFVAVVVAFRIAWVFLSRRKSEQMKQWFQAEKTNSTLWGTVALAACIFLLQLSLQQSDGRVTYERKMVEMQSRGISIHPLGGDLKKHIEAVSPDGAQFAVTDIFSLTLDLYDMKTLKRIKEIKTRLPIRSAGYSPDGRYLVIGLSTDAYAHQLAKERDPKVETESGNFMIYDLEEERRLDGFILAPEQRNEEQQKKLANRKDSTVEQVEFSLDGKYIAVSGMLGTEFWDMKTAEMVKWSPDLPKSGWPIVYWIDQANYVRFRKGGDGVYQGNINGNQAEAEIIKSEYIDLVKISPSKKYMVVSQDAENSIISIIDLKSKAEIFQQGFGHRSVRGIAFSPDEKYLAVGYDHNVGDTQEKKVLIYEIDSGKLQKEINFEDIMTDDIVYRSDGKSLMFCSYGKLIIVDVTK